MTTWTAMNRIEFDATLVRTKRQREIAVTAKDTLFPDMLPEIKASKVSQPEPELEGQDAMF